MVTYFGKTDKDTESLDKEEWYQIREISKFNVFKHLGVTFLLGCIVIYVQYKLFYENNNNNDSYSDLQYKAVMTIYIVSSTTNMFFSTRIFIMHQKEHMNLIPIFLTVCTIFLTINTYFFGYELKHNKYSISNISKIPYIAIGTVLFLFLQTTTFLQHVIATYYVIKFKLANNEFDQRKFYDLMVKAEADADLVSIIDCNLRAAPQLITQFAIIFNKHGVFEDISVTDLVSSLIAFFATPWSITSFQGSIRKQQNTEISNTAKTIYFFWHFFIMVSRIMSTSGPMAFWPKLTGLLIIFHWIGMTSFLWWKHEPIEFCDYNKFWHFLFCCVIGCVYFFTPMNLAPNHPTRSKHICFYTVLFFENFVANVVWFIAEDEMVPVYKIVFVICNQSSFAIGIGAMITYYLKFHPNKNAKDVIELEEVQEQNS